ncbi:MAG: glycyl-radical enzyme activating protein [Actinomycetota bacterium]
MSLTLGNAGPEESKAVDLKDRKVGLDGLVFNIQKYSIHDGPGIRTTVFMKGCSLACKWCSNPESVNPYQEIMTYDIRCIGCGKCAEVCPVGAIALTEEGREIDWDKCDNCLKCAEVCPAKAIECVGDRMTLDQVVKKVEQDRIFYDNSGGGMTVSGGEPLVQPEFVAELLRRCKTKGIHTALDTSGNVPWENVEMVLEHVDLVLFDIKHMDPEMHRKGTGAGNRNILENAGKVASRARTWIRIPLIPGYNDSESNISKVAEFASDIGAEKVSLLSYHDLGSSKYPKLGRVYQMEGTIPPDDDAVESVKEAIESHGLKVEVGR